ncbi:MAG: hypothetical protein LBF58_07375 [Deltaproteobacteria bacterium]|nr:hypothetical protein [Deltaproteobacteria bacterium]
MTAAVGGFFLSTRDGRYYQKRGLPLGIGHGPAQLMEVIPSRKFISLILTTQLRKMLDECNSPNRYLTKNDIFDCLKILKLTLMSDKATKLYFEPDIMTLLILDFFGIEWPS